MLLLLVQSPWQHVGRRWNYKSAVTSAAVRGGLFFTTTLSSGWDAATTALAVEFGFRFCTAGYYGALTQAFRRVQPERQAVLAALLLVPAVGHLLEFIVHTVNRTPNLEASIGASVLLTMVSTSFSLFAMRRGAFTIGPGSPSLLRDLTRLPGLIAAFAQSVVREVVRA